MSTLRFSRFDIRGMLFAELTLIVLHFHDDIVKTCRERFIVQMLLLSFWYCQDMPERFYCSDIIIVLHFHADIVKICREHFTVPMLLLSYIFMLILSRYAGKVLLFRRYNIIVLHFNVDIVKICQEGFTVLHFHFDIVKIIMPEAFYCSGVIILLSFISMLISSRYAGNVSLLRRYYFP